MGSGWIGVDLDGTLAEYERFLGATVIGPPVPAMVDRVKGWLEDGREVRIFTARIADDPNFETMKAIEGWCLEHLGRVLPVTNVKDYGMIELWDDRCVTVEQNTGRPLTPGASRL